MPPAPRAAAAARQTPMADAMTRTIVTRNKAAAAADGARACIRSRRMSTAAPPRVLKQAGCAPTPSGVAPSIDWRAATGPTTTPPFARSSLRADVRRCLEAIYTLSSDSRDRTCRDRCVAAVSRSDVDGRPAQDHRPAGLSCVWTMPHREITVAGHRHGVTLVGVAPPVLDDVRMTPIKRDRGQLWT